MFRQITLAGDAAERGLEHGRLLAAEIQQTVELYLRYFARPEAELISAADEYCPGRRQQRRYQLFIAGRAGRHVLCTEREQGDRKCAGGEGRAGHIGRRCRQ